MEHCKKSDIELLEEFANYHKNIGTPIRVSRDPPVVTIKIAGVCSDVLEWTTGQIQDGVWHFYTRENSVKIGHESLRVYGVL